MENKFLSRDKIVGKQVISGNGITLGIVKDIAFDLPGGKMSITVTDENSKETEITSDDISAVGDVVLMKGLEKAGARGVVEVPQKPSPAVTQAVKSPPSFKEPASPGLCPNCAYQNEVDSHFCIKCGTRLK
ncbi:PRC-barrel domain-containing protein [Candidatus Bathyarchaeota archaeon]|nr:PRC-barrel domain-containing protein [Candidatus Bathyarchaeota archaeon]